MSNLISPTLKDRVLTDLIAQGMKTFDVNPVKECVTYDLDPNAYIALLVHFGRNGLIQQYAHKYGGFYDVTIAIEALDLVRRGGFVAQEELIKANIEKLGWEIDLLCKELSPKLLNRAKDITAISTSILSALKLWQS